MTDKLDRLMIKAGFEADDVHQVRFRPYLYSGILFMLITSAVFLGLLVL